MILFVSASDNGLISFSITLRRSINFMGLRPHHSRRMANSNNPWSMVLPLLNWLGVLKVRFSQLSQSDTENSEKLRFLKFEQTFSRRLERYLMSDKDSFLKCFLLSMYSESPLQNPISFVRIYRFPVSITLWQNSMGVLLEELSRASRIFRTRRIASRIDIPEPFNNISAVRFSFVMVLIIPMSSQKIQNTLGVFE